MKKLILILFVCINCNLYSQIRTTIGDSVIIYLNQTNQENLIKCKQLINIYNNYKSTNSKILYNKAYYVYNSKIILKPKTIRMSKTHFKVLYAYLRIQQRTNLVTKNKRMMKFYKGWFTRYMRLYLIPNYKKL